LPADFPGGFMRLRLTPGVTPLLRSANANRRPVTPARIVREKRSQIVAQFWRKEGKWGVEKAWGDGRNL
jgi:hypothetical protein